MRQFLSTVPCSLFPVPDNCREVYWKRITLARGLAGSRATIAPLNKRGERGDVAMKSFWLINC
ncbi:MAG: hypothetical protein F6J90_08100 [Moorea sp. SIOASIH]|uniref:hypothetical protein n=1 Tax=Moorena sp. SIOASIH TaxID=2607817 RepID=UPI0013BCEE8B|nr:hypothetical protein [Moorena sp. SIOASIH]NEO36283.1 hypothetical protein [Moorena sp. SIOASIH]